MSRTTRSIGQVLEVVRSEFPDISISKIRYLESEGLLSPERDQPSGYRRYVEADIDRLRFILRTQRDQYLPLRVIREQLDRMDQGLDPEAPTPEPPPVQTPKSAPQPTPQPKAPARKAMRLSRRQLLDMSGLPEATLIELERARIITTRRGTSYFGRDALTIAVAARRLASYGLDARHLRLVYQAASQEAGLVEQAAAPYRRTTNGGRETVEDIIRLVVHAHAAMLQGLVQR